MNENYNILNIEFSKDWMTLSVNGQTYRILIAEASKQLVQATDIERRMYRISPSGYGIH